MLRKVYDIAALFALVNMVVMTGAGVYLAATGSLGPDTLRYVADGLAGKTAPAAATVPTTSDAPVPATPPPPAPITPQDLEIMRREAERFKTEIDQRISLNQTILRKVTAERDAFQKEREAAERMDRLAAEQRKEEGFKKQLKLFEGLSPKVAVDHMLGMSDVDQAALLLASLDARKAKQIIEAAKTPAQKTQMRTILERVRQVAPDRSDQIEEETAP